MFVYSFQDYLFHHLPKDWAKGDRPRVSKIFPFLKIVVTIFLPVFKNIPFVPRSKGYWLALQRHQSTPAHLVFMGTPCPVPVTCTCPAYLNVPWADHGLLSPCSRLYLQSSVHYRNLLGYLCPTALLNHQIPGWFKFSMKTRTYSWRKASSHSSSWSGSP